VSEGFEARGVENPRIVDLIAPDPQSGEVVLSVLEGRPWTGGRRQLEDHEEKLNSYFSYVLDGHLARDYPRYAGRRVRIELACPEEPGEEQRPFLAAVSRFAAEHGLRFVVRVVPEPLAAPVPWEEPADL
jgi:hypothetical protein